MSTDKSQTLANGLRITDLEVGTGPVAVAGQTLVVHYRGTLENGKQFDSSFDSDRPFSFPLGQGRVIKGWDQGVKGMRVGGRRRLVIPPELGYGSRGVGSVIPPNATLIFEVELLDIPNLTSNVYSEISDLDSPKPTPDLVLCNGFLRQQDDGDVGFERLNYTLEVTESPTYTIEDGYYQIWGGTENVIGPDNDYDISGGDNIAYAASLLLGGSVNDYFDGQGNFDDPQGPAMAHVSLLESFNNPTSMPLDVKMVQVLSGDVYETPFFSHEAVEVDGETSAIINYADSFPSEYKDTNDRRDVRFEEKLVVDKFDSFSNHPLSGYLSPSIEIEATTLSHEDSLVEWEYWGSDFGETTSEGNDSPRGGGGFFVYGNIIDEINVYRDSPWDPPNPDNPLLSFHDPTDFLDWAAGDFNGLNRDLREAHEWILDAAKYLRFQRPGSVYRESDSDTFQLSISDSAISSEHLRFI